MKLSAIGEFGLIKRLQARCRKPSSGLIAGIGDDAAAFRAGAGIQFVTADMMIEGIHFDRSFTTFEQLGHKFLAVNISDILAMGGRPEFFFISLGVPAKCKVEEIEGLYSGITKLALRHDVVIAGGDTCASRGGLVLSGTLTGRGRKIIRRSGARPGDGIYVTDTLGDSAMGLFLLQKLRNVRSLIRDIDSDRAGGQVTIAGSRVAVRSVKTLMKKHLKPEPAPLGRLSGVSAMTDISDGLLTDLDHICGESGTGAVIHEDRMPMSRELQVIAGALRRDPLQFALKGGEDYCLLFTAPRDVRTGAVLIGEIIRKGRFIIDGNGKKRKFRAEGYEHFRS